MCKRNENTIHNEEKTSQLKQIKKKKNVASVKNMHKNLMSSYMFMLYIQKDNNCTC